MAERQAENERQFTKAAESIKALLPDLAKCGVVKIVMEYDGCGDSGAVEEVTFLDKDNQPVTGIDAGDYDGPYHGIAYAILEKHHAGWENNEGAHGTVTVDVATGKVTLEHGQRVEEVIDSEHEEEL